MQASKTGGFAGGGTARRCEPPGPQRQARPDRLARYGGLARASAYLDSLGVHLGRLGHQHLQDAVLGRGFDLVRLDIAGQGDRPAERAVAALGPVDLLRGGLQAVRDHRPRRAGPSARELS
jgi:hypothetical protein